MSELQVVDYAARHGYTWEVAEMALATLRDEETAGTDYWKQGPMPALLDACQKIAVL